MLKRTLEHSQLLRDGGTRGTTLGATLRLWRDRRRPGESGQRWGSARRARGLRREELAELAGLSVDYIVRLEQGRATAPSAGVLAALGDALQLDSDERSHLYRLAGLQAPADGVISDVIPRGVQRLVSRLGDVAVGVFAADWRLLWWSDAWADLLGDPAGLPEQDRNLVLLRFPTPGSSGCLGSWPVVVENLEASDRAIVADLRRASARYPGCPRLAGLLARTIAGNARFAALWRDGIVGAHAEDRKTICHPAGDVLVDCDVLSAGDTDLKIVVMTSAVADQER